MRIATAPAQSHAANQEIPLRPEATKGNSQSTNHSDLLCAESEQKLKPGKPILALPEIA
jgi:hypothetical protein